MPRPVIEETATEKMWRLECPGRIDWSGTKKKTKMKWSKLYLRDEAGFAAWVWISVMVANYAY